MIHVEYGEQKAAARDENHAISIAAHALHSGKIKEVRVWFSGARNVPTVVTSANIADVRKRWRKV
jgi:hypothetical protein